MVKSSTLSLTLATSAWIVLLLGGFVCLAVYANTAGPEKTNPTDHPNPRLDGIGGPYRLEMFAHPRCPCTTASIHQLTQIMSRCRGKVTTTVWMFYPDSALPSWAHTELWHAAENIPGVTVKPDIQGRHANQFGATTSGHVLLYDQFDHLVFSGGITAARGHQGDNVGCDSVIRNLKGRPTKVREAPVFGCQISALEADNAITKRR